MLMITFGTNPWKGTFASVEVGGEPRTIFVYIQRLSESFIKHQKALKM